MPCQPRAFRSKCQGNKTVILKDHVCKWIRKEPESQVLTADN
jgi:hypothetical protein